MTQIIVALAGELDGHVAVITDHDMGADNCRPWVLSQLAFAFSGPFGRCSPPSRHGPTMLKVRSIKLFTTSLPMG